MSKVAIIGAGSVGTTIAYALQITGIVTEIVLVDSNRELAEGQVMDMNHGLPFVSPVRITAGEYSSCSGADVIIIAAGARQKTGEGRLDLFGRNARICQSIIEGVRPFCGEALLLVVTNPVDVMTYVVIKHAGLPVRQVIGSGTVLDSARFRYLLAKYCDIDSRNVHAYVIGEHGDSEVLLWSQARIAGIPFDQFCTYCAAGRNALDRTNIVETVRNSAYHIIEAKGATNYGVALAVTRIVEAVVRNENSVLTVSVMLNGQYGVTGCCLSVPCIVNGAGISRILETRLDPDEEYALKHSADLLKSICQRVI